MVVSIPACAVQGDRFAEIVLVVESVGINMRFHVGRRLTRIIHHCLGIQILMSTLKISEAPAMTVITLKTVDEVIVLCRPPLKHGGIIPIVHATVVISMDIPYVVGRGSGDTRARVIMPVPAREKL